VAIIELILGALFGNLGVIHVESWMSLVAGFGGILLTFLAGTEIDTDLMREKFTQTFLIGFLSFLVPFIAVFLFAYFGAQWGLEASLIAGTALSTTSLAVVYSVLIETNLSGTDVGKLLMASCFVTDMATVIALTVLFIKPTVYTGVFIAVSVVVIVLAAKFSHIVFDHPQVKD
jgi:Kef-type K+ transport system membrane component KefB